MSARKLVCTTLAALAFAILIFPGRAQAQEGQSFCPEGQILELRWDSWMAASNKDWTPSRISVRLTGPEFHMVVDFKDVRNQEVCLVPGTKVTGFQVALRQSIRGTDTTKNWHSTQELPYYWANQDVDAAYFGEVSFWPSLPEDARRWGEAVQPTMLDLDLNFIWR